MEVPAFAGMTVPLIDDSAPLIMTAMGYNSPPRVKNQRLVLYSYLDKLASWLS